MNHEQAQANLQLVLDWIDALRRGDIDAIAERFHPDVAWEDVAGGVACDGREQVLAWLRAAPAQPTDVDALELRHQPTRSRIPSLTCLHDTSWSCSPRCALSASRAIAA